MEITKEMLVRHDMAQQAAKAVTASLDGLTVVEAIGILELVKQGMLQYADDYDIGEMH